MKRRRPPLIYGGFLRLASRGCLRIRAARLRRARVKLVVMSTVGVPSPMRADARRNRELLLAAARGAFREGGADDPPREEIARGAGVGMGTLYRHFPGRAALLEAVYTDQVAALCQRADELLATEPPAAALTAWMREMADFS